MNTQVKGREKPQKERKRGPVTADSVRRTILFFMVFFASLFYIVWRLLFTMPLDHGVFAMVFGVVLWLCESTTIVETFTHFANARSVKIPEMPEIEEDMYPDVDVMIATHNESESLLYKTVNGCKYMKYPDPGKVHIFLCDDGNRPEIRALAERMGVGYFGFSGNQYAKAGNLNYALPFTHSPLIAIFDADMIPTSDFLLETVPYFYANEMIKEDGVWRRRTPEEGKGTLKELGYVQTQQSFYNPDPLQRNLYKENSAPNEQDYFYRSVNVARMNTDSAAFAGSNAVFSRQALEDIGGFEVHSITEDFVTGISILGKGYRSIAVPKELAHGLSPEDVYSFIKQRQRWSRGAAQGITNKKFWKSGLSLKAKWNFLISYFYWWTFVKRLIYILAPIVYGVFAIQVADVSFTQLIAIWLPYYLIYSSGLRLMSGGTTNAIWSDIIDTIQFPYMITPIIAGTLMIPQKKFFVTPKDRQSGKNSSIRLAIPHIILAVLSLITALICIRQILQYQQQGAIIVLYWTVYNLYALVHAIIYYFGRENQRYFERIPAPIPITIHSEGREIEGTTVDLSEGGMAVQLIHPEYLPADRDFKVWTTFKDYQATMMCRVIQVAQASDNRWRYSLQISEISERDKQEYLQILYDRDHFFPKAVDMGVVKDFKNVYRGLRAKAKRGALRRPSIPMYARLHSPEVGTIYAVNFNYKYILLHAPRALPDTLRLDFSDDIQLTCVKDEPLSGAQQGRTQLYQIEDWEHWAVQPDYRERVFALAEESGQAQYDPEIAELTETRKRERVMRKKRIRRTALATVSIAAAVVLYLVFLPNAAKEVAGRLGISTAEVGALYARAESYLNDRQYAQAIETFSGIREYRDAEQRYGEAIRGYSEAALSQAQRYQLSGEYAMALETLKGAEGVVGDSVLIEAKMADVKRKYIDDTFERADALVADGRYEDALAALQALGGDIGADASVTRKAQAVTDAYRGHYLMLAQQALEGKRFTQALSLLDEAEAKTGENMALDSKRAVVNAAYKVDFLSRAGVSLQAERFDDAIDVLLEASAVFPQEDAFERRLLEVRVAKARAEATKLAEAGRYGRALRVLTAADRALGEADALAESRAEIERAYRTEVRSRAASLMKKRQYSGAILLLKDAAQAMPEDSIVRHGLLEAQVAQASAQASARMQGGQYAAALQEIDTAMDAFGKAASLVALRRNVERAYRADILRQVDGYVRAKQFDSAILLLQDVLRTMPDDAEMGRKFYAVMEERHLYGLVVSACEQARALADGGQYARAIRDIDAALETLGQDDTLVACRADIALEYQAHVLETADVLVDSNLYDVAIEMLEEAHAAMADDRMIERKLLEVRVAKANATAFALMNMDRYAEALQDLDAAMAALGPAEALVACRATVKGAYQAYALARMDALLAARALPEAIALLEEASAAMPADAMLAQRLAEARGAAALYGHIETLQGIVLGSVSWLKLQYDRLAGRAWQAAPVMIGGVPSP